MKKTRKQFITQAKRIHGDRYGYECVEYQNTTTPVKINCKTHGPFLQQPKLHLLGCICPQCARDEARQRRMLSRDQFIERATNTHGNNYIYTNVVYVDSRTKVLIQCRQCEDKFLMRPANHIYGQGCRKCGHKRTGLKRRLSQQEFINRLKQQYGDSLVYDDVRFTTLSDSVTVACREHGQFKQRGDYLLDNKIACPECVKKSKQSKANRLGSYTLDSVNKQPDKKAIFYILKMFDDAEEFFKVGITTQPIHRRFPRLQVKGYRIRPVLVQEATLKEAFLKEQDLLQRYSNEKYAPIRKFNGHTECFAINPL